MRACLGCGRPTEDSCCPSCRRKNRQRRKAEGRTGERGSTYASRKRRERVLARYPTCVYCGARSTIEDHHVPLAEGGADDETNLVGACAPCNGAKADKMPDDFLTSQWLAKRRAAVASPEPG